MVGGPDSGLSGPQAGAMGESYSDLNAVEYLFEYGFAPTNDENPFSVGAYVTGNKERGIRNYGMNRSPLNYSNVGYDMTGPQVHADGEIWSATNFAIRQALVEKYNATFPASDKVRQQECADGKYPATQCPGNRRWIQIMYDAFLLMPSGVSMLDSRDAYLAADMARFGGANQKELWRVFASRGMGEFANSNTNADGDPVPNFESKAEANEATIKFVAQAKDEGNAAIPNAKIYVGHYEARSTQIADTDPATTVDPNNVRTKINSDTAKFVPGTYDFVVQAPGYGMQRFSLTFAANEAKTVTFSLPTNRASVTKGAIASGDGAGLNNLIDDTESTVWASLNSAPVAGKKVTVDLAGGSHTVTGVNVSALLSPTSSGRFTALRQFEVWACNQSDTVSCSDPAKFTKIFTSPADAFPGQAPRPAAPDLIMRSFAVPATQATHVQLRVVSTQCTGNPRFAGEQDNDPVNNTDCPSSAAGDDVRATEFQVFTESAPAAPSNLTAVSVNNSGVNKSAVSLNWLDNSNNEQSFEIYRSTTSATSGFGLIATVGAGVTTYRDQMVLSRATYHYYVRAVNGVGASAASNTASVTVK
jgi:extracellular elastinolytic metalloproteinase